MKENEGFSDEDIVLSEYGAIVVANEIMRMISERIEEQARKKASVQIAPATLSFGKGHRHILDELTVLKDCWWPSHSRPGGYNPLGYSQCPE